VCVFVALVTQYGKRLRRIIESNVPSLAVPCFPNYLIIGTTFEKKVMEHKMCDLIFYATFVSTNSNSKKNSARYCHKYTGVYM